MAKSKQRFSWTYNHEDSTATAVDNVTETTEVYDYSDLPEEIRDRIAVYGLGKVLQDRNSQVDADGKLEAMNKTYASLSGGTWKAERTVGARFLPPVIEAIGKRKACSVAAAQAAYRALDEAQRAVLRENLADDIREIEEARKAATEVDLDDLM